MISFLRQPSPSKRSFLETTSINKIYDLIDTLFDTFLQIACNRMLEEKF